MSPYHLPDANVTVALAADARVSACCAVHGVKDIVHDDMELMAAIGRMVVNATELEYAVAELAATAEGLRGEECRERARAIVRRTGEAMRQFERLAQERPDLGWLMRDTDGLLGDAALRRARCAAA